MTLMAMSIYPFTVLQRHLILIIIPHHPLTPPPHSTTNHPPTHTHKKTLFTECLLHWASAMSSTMYLPSDRDMCHVDMSIYYVVLIPYLQVMFSYAPYSNGCPNSSTTVHISRLNGMVFPIDCTVVAEWLITKLMGHSCKVWRSGDPLSGSTSGFGYPKQSPSYW